MAKTHHKRFAGYLLVSAVSGAALAAFVDPVFALIAGGSAWLAIMLLWSELHRGIRIMVVIMIASGTAGMGWGLWRGVTPLWVGAISGNMPLVAMLIGVSFLQLVAVPRLSDGDDLLPVGGKAFLRTILSVHLFSSVINLSAIPIVGDRLHSESQLIPAQAIILSRGFAAAAFWSPFFASMAAALNFAPDAQFGYLLLVGVPMGVLALAGTCLGTGRHIGGDFKGYPLRYSTLRVPLLLAVGVLTTHYFYPELSVIGVITVLAPVITVVALMPQGRTGTKILLRHITANLPRMGNELALFLSAGVLAAGLYSIIAEVDGWTPFASFGLLEAWLTTVAITALSFIGVHQVIGVAVFGTLLIPISPDHNLLAMSFLLAWGISSTASPLSGLNLMIQGRYGIDARGIMLWNWRYVVGMLTCAAPALWMMEWMGG